MSSALNSSSSPLGANTEFQGTYEFLNVDRHGVQVACSTDAEGVLVIEFSQNKNDIIYSHNFPIEVDVSFSRAVSKKANYFRVRLINGPAPQTTLQLATIIQTTYQPDVLDIELDSATSSITMFGTDSTGTLRAVKTTNDGSLVVSGGSGGGDASAANQTTQIDIATNSNLAVCSRLTTIDTSANNIEVILDNYVFTSGNLHVRDDTTLLQLQGSNLAQYGKLDLIEQGINISSEYLQSINLKSTPLQQGIARYTLEAKTTLAPDTVPSYTTPPSGVAASEGWYYKNLALGNNSQLYYYANQESQTKNFDYQIGSVQSQWAVVRILNLNSSIGLPFLVVYSQPEGAGDHIPGFARSSWVYEISSTAELRLGEKVVIYREIEPDLRVFPELRRVECVLSVTNGPGLTSEKLAYATVNTDSGAEVGNAEYIISGAGLTFLGDHVYKVELTGENSVLPGNASAANQLDSNLAVCARLDTANTTLGLINTTLDQITFSNSNLFVYDAASNLNTSLCLAELEFINGSIDAVKDGTSQFWVHTTSADDSIEIHGYNPTLSMPEVIHTVNNCAKVYVDNASIAVNLSATADVSVQNSSLDVHCYGSTDGTPGNWYHLKTSNQGELQTYSQTRDGAGNSITSTAVSGTESYTGLDVVCKNTVSVQNATGTQLEVIKPNATVFPLYTGAISGSFLGNLDLDGYSSFDLLVLIPGGATSASGSLYICISDNGSDWYFTSQSVFINTDASDRRYTTTMSSLNSRYVCVTGTNPFGTPMATTDSTIKVSAKK